MADRPINLGLNILDRGKGKAPATHLDQHNDMSSPIDRSREQSALFLSDAPQATDENRPRQRVSGHRLPSERMADFQEGRAAKRARTAASTPRRSPWPPRPSIEDVEDEGDEQTDTSGHHGRRTVTRQPELVGSQAPQAPQNVQPLGLADTSKMPIPRTGGPRDLTGENYQQQRAGRARARAAQPDSPANSALYLTVEDDEPQGEDGPQQDDSKLPRTGIKKIRKTVRTECRTKCELAASTLEGRTDKEGREIYQRCVGTCSLLQKAKTLALVRRIMVNDVKSVLADASATLTQELKQYTKFYESINDVFDKRDAKTTLDRRNARLETVQQVQNFRKSLVNDLNEQSDAFLKQAVVNEGQRRSLEALD